MKNLVEILKEDIYNSKEININDISNNLKEDTALIVIDMIKGFYNEGLLASNRVENVILPISNLITNMNECKKIVFIDSHTKDSSEFNSYPVHCIKGSNEENLIDEIEDSLKEDKNYKIIKKNSINGFHSLDFQKWLNENNSIKNFIVVGVCTDICVETFAISLKTYFNENNINKRIVVPINCVETYSFGNHNGDFMNIVSLFKMQSNGIDIVKSIIS